MSENVLHCFEQSTREDNGDLIGVCLLELDHDGAHEFTPHEQIEVRISEEER